MGVFVEVLKEFKHQGRQVLPGVVIEIDRPKASHHLEAANVAPAIEVVLPIVQLADVGLPIFAALEAHIATYKDLDGAACSIGAGSSARPTDVEHYRNRPTWTRPVAQRHRGIRSHGISVGRSDTGFTDHQPPPQPDVMGHTRQYIIDCAVADFMAYLAEGAFVAEGIYENDLASLKRNSVPKEWWGRRVSIDLAGSAIHEAIGSGQSDLVRRFSDVRVRNASISGRAANTSKLPTLKASALTWEVSSLSTDETDDNATPPLEMTPLVLLDALRSGRVIITGLPVSPEVAPGPRRISLPSRWWRDPSVQLLLKGAQLEFGCIWHGEPTTALQSVELVLLDEDGAERDWRSEFPARGSQSTSRVELNCEKHLRVLAAADQMPAKDIAFTKLQKEEKSLSKNAFERIWRKVAEDYPRMSKPGRKPKQGIKSP